MVSDELYSEWIHLSLHSVLGFYLGNELGLGVMVYREIY